MPKIPTFKAQGTITSQTGAETIGVQVPLSMAQTLAPLQRKITDYAIKERIIQDKTEALKLENESILELNDVVFEASKMMNKEQANIFLKKESEIIRNKYRNKASSKSVRTLFDNYYLAEEQKQIYKVDGEVFKNIIENNKNEKSKKGERIIAEALYSKNPLQEKQLYNDLVKLEDDDIIQDDSTRAENISAIPGKIDFFKARKAINDNPLQALKDIRNIDDGPYKNLPLRVRQDLESDALTLSRPVMVDKIKNHFSRLENGIDSTISHKDVNEILGKQSYDNFYKKEKLIIRTTKHIRDINLSKRGEEQKIIDNFIKDEKTATLEDLAAKQKLIQASGRKKELLNKDPAALIITTNTSVSKLYEDFASEKDEKKRDAKFDTYLGAIKQAQITMGVDNDDIKLLPKSVAIDIVKQYNNLDKPEDKIIFLRQKELEYKDENFGIFMKQLAENGLPMTARLVSYFGDRNFAEKALSFDSKEERERLDTFLKGTEYNSKAIKKEIREELADFRVAVTRSNPFNTSKANQQLDEIESVMYYSVLNDMSAGKSKSQAVKNSTKIIVDNFDYQEDYFIPKIIDGKKESNEHIQFIKDQAKAIKDYYVDLLPIIPMESQDKTISSEEIMGKNRYQIKENGVWLNMANGDGLFLAIKYPNGEHGPVFIKNKDGKRQRVEIDFNNFEHIIKGTDIKIDLKSALAPKPEKPESP